MSLFDLDLLSLQGINDVPGVIMQHMTPSVENIPVFIMMAINIALGFLIYINVGSIQKRDQVDCYPMNLHCCLIVWDTLCSIMCWVLMVRYNFFWLFTLFGILEPIWVWGEIKAIKAHIKTSRQEEFGKYVSGPISEKQAWIYTVIMLVIWLCFWCSISFVLGGFYNASLLVTWPWTNFLIPWICWGMWESRIGKTGTQIGNSTRVQMTLVVQTLLSWFPFTWFVLMMPFLSNPVFYIMGALTTALCIRNYLKVRKLPMPDEKAKAIIEAGE